MLQGTGGGALNFQNQVKILKGPNSFWVLRAGVWQQKSWDKAGMRGEVHKLPKSNKILKGPNSFWGLMGWVSEKS